MKVSNLNTYIKAIVMVEAEGYFVERLINLCKINNINIWNIKFITDGKIEFYISLKDFKKIKPYVKKSKCKVRVINKKGIYFNLFKYRKRKLALFLLIGACLITTIISTFIWKINVTVDPDIKKTKVEQLLKEMNINVGKNKMFISKGKISDYIRANMYEAAWVGVDIKGQSLDIIVKSKIISKEEDKSILGNIVATKSGVITKIIAEDGTALYKTGSYIEKGKIAIEGVRKSEYIDEVKVHASGIVNAIVEYKYEKEYKFNDKIKEYTGKKRHSFGIKVNNKKFLIKYLKKDLNYDINSNVKTFGFLGLKISLIFNTYDEYYYKDIINTKEELIKKGEKESALYFKKIKINNEKVVDKKVEINEINEKIYYKVLLYVEEPIGKFVETGDK